MVTSTRMDKITILALTKYSYEGPSSRYRFYNYQNCFEKNGIDMTIKPLFDRSYFISRGKLSKIRSVFSAYIHRFFLLVRLLFSRKKYDLILIEYELFPYLPAWFEFLLYMQGIQYIVDYDDAIFHKYDMSKNLLIKIFLKNKISKVIQCARHVTVCNSYLEAYVKQYNNQLIKLPTVVLLDNYIEKMQNFKKKNDDLFVIGWIGSRTTSVYILEILPSIEKFVNKYPDVRFDLVGFDASLLSDEEIGKYHINIIPWREDNEIENILQFDVGIMPLQDDPWSRGKCGFKLVQYMSCKKPVIASPVGINKEIVENRLNGFLVKTLHEWFDAFEKLYLERSLMCNMSEINFRKIQEEFNYHKNCQKYLQLIQDTV